MLPGFRFLFAAIALSVSILVFGLGAAALLRAAHEEFASNSSWRAAPEQPIVAQLNEPAKPVLALLRFDPPHPTPKAPEQTVAQESIKEAIKESTKETIQGSPPESTPHSAGEPPAEATALGSPVEQDIVVLPAADARTIAALESKDTAPSVGTTKAEDTPAEATVADDAKPAPVLAMEPPAETEQASIQETQDTTIKETRVATADAANPSTSDGPSVAVEAGTSELMKPEAAQAAPAKSEAVNTEITASESAKPEPAVAAAPPASNPAIDPAASRIATLGGPAVTIEDEISKQAENEKAERSAKAQRRAEARGKARRRAALRARLARRQALAQQAAQQAADPFGAIASQASARQIASGRTPRSAQ